MSRVGVGIDFGTSNSVAAVYDGENLSLIRLEKGQDIMPSATYLDSSKVAITGEVAVSTYIRDNTGRTVELVAYDSRRAACGGHDDRRTL